MHLRPLPDKLQKKAETKLNEVPSRIQADLDHIKEWITKQPQLNAKTDDQWLISFLRCSKFDMQRTKQKIDSFYTIRALVPEMFTNRDPFSPEIQEVLSLKFCLFTLRETKGDLGPRVVVTLLEKYDFNKRQLISLFKVYFMMAEILMLEDDDCVISGICLWLDFKGVPPNALSEFNSQVMRRTLVCLQSAYPLKVKGGFYTNMSPAHTKVFDLINTFVNTKIQRRRHLYAEGNFNQIYEQIPQHIHPTETGGNGGNIAELATYWKEKIESYREWFTEE